MNTIVLERGYEAKIIQRQKQLETDAITNGVNRYHKQLAVGPHRSKPGTELLRSAIGPLAEAILTEQKALVRNNLRKPPGYAIPLLLLDHEKLALITLQYILNLVGMRGSAGSSTTVAYAARAIGEKCRIERYFDELNGRARNLEEILQGRNKNISNARIRACKLAERINSGTEWSQRDIGLRLGAKLVDLAIKHTNLFYLLRKIDFEGGGKHPKTVKTICLTENISQFLAVPIYLPMIIKPTKWVSLSGGGYLTIPDIDLVKHQNNRQIVSVLKSADLSTVFAAVNALQETPWCINKHIYNIMRKAWERGMAIGGLPSSDKPLLKPQGDTLVVTAAKAKQRLLRVSNKIRNKVGHTELSDSIRDVSACAGLLLALEKYGSLDCKIVARCTIECLALSQKEYVKYPTSNGPLNHKNKELLQYLVEYRLYEDLRRGWRISLPSLESSGIIRIEYLMLTETCRKEELWLENTLLKGISPEKREYIATVVLKCMRENLAISAHCLDPVARRELRRQVVGNIRSTWSFSKHEKLRYATVFVDPQRHAEYILGERSLSIRSRLGRFISEANHWDRSRNLDSDEYINLLRALLGVLQRAGLLVSVNSIKGQSGFQIAAKCLRWVCGDGTAPAPDPLRPHLYYNQHVHSNDPSAYILMNMRMDICKELVNEERFFFPYQLDYRGRAYPIPQVFNPQSHDIGRALLEFADGKPLGKRGSYWLAVHLANTFGMDKVSFHDRVKWVKRHEAEIKESVKKPLGGKRFWEKAEKPWCFLAACYEWVGYRKYGHNFFARLPISMDGTCNGLQHLSAMALDLKGGKATNLVPGEKPKDLYQQVANRLAHRLRIDAQEGIREASSWLNWITEQSQVNPRIKRKLVKHATMTTPYGVKPYGIRRQLVHDGFTAHLEEQDEWDDTEYLRHKVEESIGDVIVKAKRVMKWLQDVAKVLASADQGVCWTTPVGFPVVVEHRERKKRRIRTVLGNLLVEIADSPLELRKNKQVNTIAPNFVHSMDAAHMMLTINRLYEEGGRHFAMIHDSYGVHACDVERMNQVLREEFVRIYREPILARFLAEQHHSNPSIKLPRLLKRGNLNINSILDSDYFFS